MNRLDPRQWLGDLLQQPRFGQSWRQRWQCIDLDSRQFVHGKGVREAVDFQPVEHLEAQRIE